MTKKRRARRRRLRYSEFVTAVREWAYDSKWNDNEFRVGVQIALKQLAQENKPNPKPPHEACGILRKEMSNEISS